MSNFEAVLLEFEAAVAEAEVLLAPLLDRAGQERSELDALPKDDAGAIPADAALSPEVASAVARLLLPGLGQVLAAAMERNLDERFQAPFDRAHALLKNLPLPDGLASDIASDLDCLAALLMARNRDFASLQQALSLCVLVSITSYPARIGAVRGAVDSIRRQSFAPDRVVLWLADTQFPNGLADLPTELVELVDSGELIIEWCADLRPHKKYFYALKRYPEALLITFDDDLDYDVDTMRALFRSFLCYPRAISGVRAHLMLTDSNDAILPYGEWPKEIDAVLLKPSMQLVLTGGAGALYPPGLLDVDLMDEDLIRATCLHADDLWLKAVTTVLGIPVVVACEYAPPTPLPYTQGVALWKENVVDGGNDTQLKSIVEAMDARFGKGEFVRRLLRVDDGWEDLRGYRGLGICCKRLSEVLRQRNDDLKDEMRSLKAELSRKQDEVKKVRSSTSFRIGKMVTAPVRLLKRKK